ncbi:unnamed protein product [Mytilus coruscus]|uniref:C2H2-type domain-containing protein n=1 Tax=Mytilus coruscus TaxID=42192 RepID=A0A6J8D8C4_MYTCO|nr:unnamed protein product [Mytilus coruscus]
MSSEEPLNLMAEEDNFDSEKLIEFYYSAYMLCPVTDCDFGGKFATKTKYSRHWEERHIFSVQKMECAIQHCTSRLRRKSDMKSHLRYVHGERDGRRVEEIMMKCQKVTETGKKFINLGFFVFKGRTQKSVDSSKPTSSSQSNISTATTSSSTVTAPTSTVTSIIPATTSEGHVTSSVVPSPMVISSVLTSACNQDDDIQFNVHLPACLPASPIIISTSTPQPSSSPLVLILPPTKTRVSIEEYRNRPARESNPPFLQPVHTSLDNFSQTSGMDVREVNLPPIPDTVQKVQEHIGTLCDLMDKVGRQRDAAKSKLEVLRKEGPSLQKEKEIRRKLESENRELKRQLSEYKWRENLVT